MIKKDHVEFYDTKGNKVNKEILNLSKKDQIYDKGEYKHFMAKEIEEQPLTINNCVKSVIFLSKFFSNLTILSFFTKTMVVV